MWNSPNKSIPPENILKSHLDELEQAVMDADMFNIAERSSVYDALEYIQTKHSYASHRCSIFKEVLENHSEFPMVAASAAAPQTYDKVHGANCPSKFQPGTKPNCGFNLDRFSIERILKTSAKHICCAWFSKTAAQQRNDRRPNFTSSFSGPRGVQKNVGQGSPFRGGPRREPCHGVVECPDVAPGRRGVCLFPAPA